MREHAARTRRALERHVEYLRTLHPPRPTQYYVLAAELAERTGADVAAVIEEFDERAGCREYVGGQSRPDAERDAWLDTEARYERQMGLAV